MTSAQSQALWRRQNRERFPYFRKYSSIWAKYYAQQGQIIIDNIHFLTDDLIFKTEDITTIFEKMYIDVGVHFAGQSFINVKSSNPKLTVKQSTTKDWRDHMIDYVRKYGGASIVSISETGLSQAIKIVQSATEIALERGLSPFDAEQFIEQYIRSEWKIAGKFNAERIARTEILTASNEGAFAGAESTGLKLNKTWLTSLDGRERESHAAANNQTVSMYDSFIVGISKMSKPGDKSAPAEETIQCRCGVVFQSVELLNSPLTDFR